jgi:hypothetical protein
MAVPASRPESLHCACASPIPVERATRKGASRTECSRCGRPVRIRLVAPRRIA